MATATKAKRRPKKTYEIRDGFRIPVSGQIVGKTIEAIKRRNAGSVTPSQVIDEAQSEDSPLHPCFTWDDSDAAQKYREEEARRLIRCYVIVWEDPDETPRQIANVCITRED